MSHRDEVMSDRESMQHARMCAGVPMMLVRGRVDLRANPQPRHEELNLGTGPNRMPQGEARA